MEGVSCDRDRPVAYEEKRSLVRVPVLILERSEESLRCIRLATGQLVYDFWSDGKRVARIDADAYDHALREARAHPQQEVPDGQ